MGISVGIGRVSVSSISTISVGTVQETSISISLRLGISRPLAVVTVGRISISTISVSTKTISIGTKTISISGISYSGVSSISIGSIQKTGISLRLSISLGFSISRPLSIVAIGRISVSTISVGTETISIGTKTISSISYSGISS